MWTKSLCPNTGCDPHVAPSADPRQQVHMDPAAGGTVLWDSPLKEEPALGSVTAPPITSQPRQHWSMSALKPAATSTEALQQITTLLWIRNQLGTCGLRLIKKKVITQPQSIDRSGYMCRWVCIRVFVIYLCVLSSRHRLVTVRLQATPLSYLTSHLSA